MIKPLADSTNPVCTQLVRILGNCVGAILASTVLNTALQHLGLDESTLRNPDLSPEFAATVERGLRVFCKDDLKINATLQAIARLAREHSQRGVGASDESAIHVTIDDEDSIISARVKAREAAVKAGFGYPDQIKIATAVSEMARNIFHYAKHGSIQIAPTARRDGLKIEARDRGPGIRNLEQILAGQYRSKSGLGLGILGCRKLMDRFDIQTGPGGTTVLMEKYS